MQLLDRLPPLAERALTGARRAGAAALPVARRAGAAALPLARRAAEPLQRRRVGDRPPPRPADRPLPATAAPAAQSPPAPAHAPSQPAPAPEAAAAAAPEHVDREAVVVAASADPEASGDVGPEIRIDEPWEGYDELNKRQVVAALEDATPAMLAVARLYEVAHRDRAAVIDEIDRRLSAASG